MTEQQLKIIGTALGTYGLNSQMTMLVEETGELLNAIGKWARGRVTSKEVITELADVSIMVEQMAIHFGYAEYIKERDRKIQRLKERLNKSES